MLGIATFCTQRRCCTTEQRPFPTYNIHSFVTSLLQLPPSASLKQMDRWNLGKGKRESVKVEADGVKLRVQADGPWEIICKAGVVFKTQGRGGEKGTVKVLEKPN